MTILALQHITPQCKSGLIQQLLLVVARTPGWWTIPMNECLNDTGSHCGFVYCVL